MDLEMVLNELSLREPANDIHEARQRMSELIQTVIMATAKGVKRVIRTHRNFDFEVLAPGYPVIRWSNDPMVDKEARRYFRSLATKSPYLEDILDLNIRQKVSLSDFFQNEEQAEGFGIAYWLEALAISLKSSPRWNTSYIQIKVSQLDETDELIDTIEQIPHASSSSHVNEHLVWIKERLQQSARNLVDDGMTIWKHREEWFPNLYFCEVVQGHLQALPRGHLWLMPIMKRLYELEDFCEHWYEGPFEQTQMVSKVTNESDATMKQYSQERTFQCPDHIWRTFRWHIRFTPNAGRLYFYPLSEERKLIIGYIGSHLNTVKYH